MMKKLVCLSNGSKSAFFNILRVFYFSSETLNSSSSSSSSSGSPPDTLYRRISPIGSYRVSVVPVLDQWIEEGKSVYGDQLRVIIKQLKSYRRYSHALQISQWMSDRRYMLLSEDDVAIRLDLISKVHGLDKAEEYFDNIPKQLKGFKTYVVLLNCYAYEKSVEKAEVLMRKMKKLGFTQSSVSYNVLLNLYSKAGQYEKLDTLVEQMKEKGIREDKFTFSSRLAAYANTSNIEGMEKILSRIKAADLPSYFIASKGYIKAGLIDKALELLKKIEGRITRQNGRISYECLLSMYTSIGRKDDFYRIWNLYKSSEKLYNSAYLCMIVSLLKFDDIVGAEEIFQEWEAANNFYDFRVPHVLFCWYCKNALLDKAEKLMNEATDKGKSPFASTWECMASGLVKAGRIPEAVDAIKKAILIRPKRKPDHNTVATCLHYLEEKGDAEGIKEFGRLLGVVGPLPTDACEPESDSLDEMNGVTMKLQVQFLNLG